MLTVYPACFIKDEGSYAVIFPDLNWLATCGETLEEAMAMAVDCLAGYIYVCKKDGDFIPGPSEIHKMNIQELADEIECSPEDMFINMVAVDVEAYAKEHFEKSVKKTLIIPAWLNKLAMEQNINFSQVLQEALLAKVKLR